MTKDFSIVVVDIDNTLVSTKESFILYGLNLFTRMRLLAKPKWKIISKVRDFSNGKGLIILSARPKVFYPTTFILFLFRLRRKFKLVLVRTAYEKIAIITKLGDKNILYIDDLSYNHEYGTIRFYDDVINVVSRMKNVSYLGNNWIEENE